MAGYDGCRMSNNAVAAYENGEMPISKWTKKMILEGIEEKIENEELLLKCSFEKLKKVPKGALQEHCLRLSSQHHTGGDCRETYFHELDSDKIECNAALYSRRKRHFIFDAINTITAPSFR